MADFKDIKLDDVWVDKINDMQDGVNHDRH